MTEFLSSQVTETKPACLSHENISAEEVDSIIDVLLLQRLLKQFICTYPNLKDQIAYEEARRKAAEERLLVAKDYIQDLRKRNSSHFSRG